MKDKHIKAFMNTAYNFAVCSTAARLKVGCIIIKDNRIISIGYNGTPSGWDNECEHMSLWMNGKLMPEPVYVTKPEVLHAETNAIAKLARTGGGGEGATLFVTHSPCLDCSKLIFQSGINSVYYGEKYRSSEGLEFLAKCNVPCTLVPG